MTYERSKEELLEDARRGDRDAFERLTSGVRRDLSAFARSRMGPVVRQKTEIEDVVQETLLIAFGTLSRFRPRGPDSLERWLFAIAENLIRNISRKRSIPTRSVTLEPRSVDPSPSRAMRREERLDRLRRSLASLNSDHRTVIELARIEGLKIREIAERMDRSTDAVKKLLSRALEKLRDRFGDTESLSLPEHPWEEDDD